MERRGARPRRSKRRTSTDGKEMRPAVEARSGRRSSRIKTNEQKGKSLYFFIFQLDFYFEYKLLFLAKIFCK